RSEYAPFFASFQSEDPFTGFRQLKPGGQSTPRTPTSSRWRSKSTQRGLLHRDGLLHHRPSLCTGGYTIVYPAPSVGTSLRSIRHETMLAIAGDYGAAAALRSLGRCGG